MSVARITTINFENKEDADKSIEDYSEKAPSEFPEAEQLLQIRASDTRLYKIICLQEKSCGLRTYCCTYVSFERTR